VVGWRKEYSTIPFFPYFLFLKKDFLSLFDNLDRFFYWLLDLLLLFIITTLSFLSLVVFANSTFALAMDLTFVYYIFLSGGRFALLLYFASFFTKGKGYGYFLSWMGIVIVLYLITFPILENSFALK
jgi:hypothetical protein